MSELEQITQQDDCYKPVPRSEGEFDPIEELSSHQAPPSTNRLIVELPNVSIIETGPPRREQGVTVRADGIVTTPGHIVIPRPEHSSLQLEEIFRRVLEHDRALRNYYDCEKNGLENYRRTGQKIGWICPSPGPLELPGIPTIVQRHPKFPLSPSELDPGFFPPRTIDPMPSERSPKKNQSLPPQ